MPKNSPSLAYDVVALGHTTREMLAWVDRYPEAGDGIFAEQVLWTGGGMAGNLVQTVARLGGKAALATALGDDVTGDQTIEQLQKAGVDTSYILRRQNAVSPVTVLMVNPALERAGLVTDLPPDLKIRGDEVPDELLLSARLFFTDMEPAEPAIEVAQRAKSLGVPIAFDMQLAPHHANLSGHSENIAQMYVISDYFFADEENFLFWRDQENIKEAISGVLDEHPELTIVITRGSSGSLIATAAKMIEIPAFDVEVVDTIGAGDAYHGAFLYTHLSLGWDLEAAGLFSSATAALSCTKAGARDGLPNMEQVKIFLSENGHTIMLGVMNDYGVR